MVSRTLPVVLVFGCGVDAGMWDGVPIAQAHLETFDLSSLAVVAGTQQGDALLVFEEVGGTVGSVPVHLGGGSLGVALDLSLDPEGHEGVVDIDLTDVEAPTVGDVFGTYHGTGGAGAAFVGGSRRRMRNGQGASFREDHFALGLSVFIGYEWITVREGGNDDGVHPTSTPGTPADSEDTGAFTTPADTGAPTARVTDTPGADTAGCTGTEVAETSESGSDCSQDDETCSCAHGSAAPVGWLALIALLRRRRRATRVSAS